MTMRKQFSIQKPHIFHDNINILEIGTKKKEAKLSFILRVIYNDAEIFVN